jgi:very-short-patch-repair endonuclease
MRKKAATRDVQMAALAEMQHGVVTRRQLLAVGIGDSAIFRRVQGGRLHRVHQGVYAAGHPVISQEGRWMAAVLACEPDAVLSLRSAAEHWGLLKPQGGLVHVSVPTSSGRERREGLRIHRCHSLQPDETTWRHRIPITTPARTIADLRGTVPPEQYRRAVRQAEVKGLQTGLDETVAPTRSELEDLFLQLCRRHRLPAPEVNVRVAGREVDFLWRRQWVVAETDGYRYHRGSTAFEDDHDRDLDLRAAGFAVLRFTFRQVTADPERVAISITKELEPASGRAPTHPAD